MKKYELYEKLLNMNGISGQETHVKKFVREELKKYSDEIIQDKLGGVFGVSRGEGPTIMFAAHMDEVGFMVIDITANGFIKILPIGGITPETYLSQNMNIVISDKKVITGVIGATPPHLSSGNEKITADDLLLDIGAASKEEALKLGVLVGQQVVSVNNLYYTADKKKIVSKACDDRLGVAICLELLQAAHQKKHPNTIICGGTVQEEVGLRGAQVATQMIKPDLFIAIDVSPANDFSKTEKPVARLGEGFLVRFYDPRCIMNRSLHNYFVELAKKENIKAQEFLSFGGTDAAVAQYAGEGTLATTIGIPGRYIHTTAAMVHLDDIEAVKKMALAVIETFDQEKFEQIKKEY